MRRMHLFCDLQRQHPGACAATHRRSLAGRSGCYLDDDEIGASGTAPRVKVTLDTDSPERLRMRLFERAKGNIGRVALHCLVLVALTGLSLTAAAADAPALFQQHCASCHGANRVGAMGPALLPESLAPAKGRGTTSHRRRPRSDSDAAFGAVLGAEEIDALASYIYTPVLPVPSWSEADIRSSRVELHAPGSLPDKPVFDADPMNLFLVVEAGDHHVSVLDGDKMERIHRFPSRFALHGGAPSSALTGAMSSSVRVTVG